MTDYGLDVSTFPDLDVSFLPISGTRVVGEAVARRWYVELTPYVNANVTGALLATIRPKLEAAAYEDERVASISVELWWDGYRTVKARGTITTVEDETFSLVFDAATLTLEAFGG